MPSQKAPKPARDMTTKEAIEHLFPKPVIDHAKRHANAVPRRKGEPEVKPDSMNEL
ncbi:MAG: hypothetical protein HY263_01765 [Chloroflexi bacterium]|nr:hypothetical protein [Chloroflexota bacterium]